MSPLQIYVTWADEILQIASQIIAYGNGRESIDALEDAHDLVVAHQNKLRAIRRALDEDSLENPKE